MLTTEDQKSFFEAFKSKLSSTRTRGFTFMLAGRTGVGKSSTINSLLGTDIAPVGAYEPTTFEVKDFRLSRNGIDFIVYDTPGLCDDLEERGNDHLYISKMRNTIKEIDCLWFVTRMDETRVTNDEKRAIRIITDALGPQIWQHSIILFTFATAQLPPNQTFDSHIQNRMNVLRKEIAQYAGAINAESIPAVPVENMPPKKLPDGSDWLGELWVTVLKRLSPLAGLSFLAGTGDRAKSGDIPLTPKQKQEAKEISWKFITGGAATGAAIGSILGPVGSAIGGFVGGVVGGFFSWLFG